MLTSIFTSINSVCHKPLGTDALELRSAAPPFNRTLADAEPRAATMRRRAAVLAVVAVGAAMEWKPSFSFRDSAKWVVDRAPGRYAQALRDLGACLHCDGFEVSPRRVELVNATLTLNGSTALRVGALAVTCARPWDWSPLVVGVEVDTLEVFVEAHDLLLRDTNWHHFDELEAALAALAPAGGGAASGVERLEFAGVARCELTPPPALGGAGSRLVLTLDWERDFAALSRRVAELAAEGGGVSPEAIFELFKAQIFRQARKAFADALEQRARDPSNSAISLAGVDVDLLRPRASLDALRDAAVGRAKKWFAETTGVGDADLEAAVLGLADALRRSAAEAATDVIHAAEELDEFAAEALREIDGASEAAHLADAVDAEIAAGVADADPAE